MYLNREEERMLDGEFGEGVAKCMKLLVTLGELFEAKEMVKIRSSHVSGVSYKNIGDPGLELIESFAEENVKVKVKTTLNPMGMDRERWKEMGLERSFAEKQLRIVKAYEKMGVISTCTCTPYLVGNNPKFGEHVAWAETSATVYANSVLGAKTNRESGLSAFASAVTGRTPYYGYHLEENRKPTVHVKLKFKPKDSLEFSVLGYLVGKNFPNSVPFISGLHEASLDELKTLGAGLASAGAITLYHVEKLTPESRFFRDEDVKNCEKFSVGQEDIRKTISEISEEEFDCVFLGCPHCSLEQLENVADFLRGKKVNCRLWVFTSKQVFEKAKKLGYIDIIESAGGLVLSDTCMIVSPFEKLNITKVVTDSCKAAYYLPSTVGVKVKLENPRKILEEITV
ncbi:hypothetical protein DRO26_04970 [Candidatus Bathyarchaeota archaeon]|nr:MAG: hypothetical protein DRO26_04970 [Candidatus Bathyarchaeota archaeon]